MYTISIFLGIFLFHFAQSRYVLISHHQTWPQKNQQINNVEGLLRCVQECGENGPHESLLLKEHISDSCTPESSYQLLCTKVNSFKVSKTNKFYCHEDTMAVEEINGKNISGWILPGHYNNFTSSESKKSAVCKLTRR